MLHARKLPDVSRGPCGIEIAQAAKSSARFRTIAAAIGQLPSNRREAVLARAARIAHPTWAELGHITPDGSGQTEAGAAAERDISAALVIAVREIVAEIHSPGAKISAPVTLSSPRLEVGRWPMSNADYFVECASAPSSPPRHSPLDFSVRQKKSWVDSGSGSLPSE